MKTKHVSSDDCPASYQALNFLLFAFFLILTLHPQLVVAQVTNVTDGYTPLWLAPGTPTGSYALSGFDNINLFNGHMNFALPLRGIKGRGPAAPQIYFRWDLAWSLMAQQQPTGGDLYVPTVNAWQPFQVGYGAATLLGRMGSASCGGEITLTLTRFTFQGGDGTEYELRDQLTGGEPENHPCPLSAANGQDRGTVFITADGTSARFIADQDVIDGAGGVPYANGKLFLRDGTVYRFDGGVVSWIRDTNGNKTTYAYDSYSRVTSITDSTNRPITIAYRVNDGSPYGTCDNLTFSGFGGAARVIRVCYAALDTALRSGFAIETYQQLFPEPPMPQFQPPTFDPPSMPTAIWLPNGQEYTFQYDSYGEMSRVNLPTGGAFEYDYNGGFTTGYQDGVFSSVGPQIYRRVVERRAYIGSALQLRQTFSRPETQPGVFSTPYVLEQQHDGSGTLLSETKEYFFGDPAGYGGPLGYPWWQDGKKYEIDNLSSDGSSVLMTTVNTFVQRAPVPWWTGSASQSPENDPRITQTVRTLVDTSQISQQSFSYDAFNNTTDTYQYDYGSGRAGNLLRRLHTDYLTTNAVNNIDYTSDTVHILTRPSREQVFDGGNTERSRTTYEYDNYNTDAHHAGLLARTNISGHDSTYSTAFTARGNPTAISRSDLLAGLASTTYAQFDIAGNKVVTIDPNGNSTLMDFSDRFGSPNGEAQSNTPPGPLNGLTSFAYPTAVTNALSQVAYSQYDYYLGRAVDTADANGVDTSFSYSDSLDRETQVVRAYGLSGSGGTTISYNDSNRVVSFAEDQLLYGDGVITKSMLYDQLGRETERLLTSDPDGTTEVDFGSDGLGRKVSSTNPYRPTQAGSTDGTTGYVYDALSRICVTVRPGGTAESQANGCPSAAPQGDVFYRYSGNCTITTDEAGNSRKSCQDPLGRVTGVWEDPSGLNYETDYQYDALGNLTAVTQQGSSSANSRNRSFQYNSLSRLVSATNPETGTIGYSYYSNSQGALCSGDPSAVCIKTAPSPNQRAGGGTATVTTTYSYDPLNRVSGKIYQDSYSGSPQTPSVYYAYDGRSLSACSVSPPALTDNYPIGHRTSMCHGSGAASWNHDPLGRISTEKRTLVGSANVTRTVSYGYNLDDSLATLTYPSSRMLTYAVGGAGRPLTVTETAHNISYLTSATYAPPGQLYSFAMGNSSIAGAMTYNSHLEPLQAYYTTGSISSQTLAQLLQLPCPSTAATIMSRSYDLGLGANDNGNIHTITDCLYSDRTQHFDYDSLNRLSDAYTTGTASKTSNWGEVYTIDAWGNLTNIALKSGWKNSELLNAAPASTYNQLNGFCYDTAGNMSASVSCPSSTYVYDGENRVVSTAGWTYVYDGDGRRAIKCNGAYPSCSAGTLYWSDVSGNTLDESDLGGAQQEEYVYFGGRRIARRDLTGNTVHYFFADHLGSTNIITNSSGSIQKTSAYYPFGGEIVVTGGSFANNYKFTGKERDAESGLDNFGARYNASSLGRFMTPDPLMASGHARNPQTWNRYAYALNNPVRFVDPNGMEVPDSCAKDSKCTIVVKVNVIYDKTVNNGKGLTDQQKQTFEKDQIGKATNAYGTSNIKLDVSYTAGSYTVGSDGKTYVTGLQSNALNVVASNATPSGAAGDSEVIPRTNTAVTFINVGDAHSSNAYPLWTNTTEHELAHQFLGDVYQQPNPFSYEANEFVVDAKVAAQAAGVSQQSFRTGLEPRSYAAPQNPEAIKPQQ